jgi:hypothetical protein
MRSYKTLPQCLKARTTTCMLVRTVRILCCEPELTRASILEVGDLYLPLGRRQSTSAFQTNTSQTFTPPATQRWTISTDAQIQALAGDGTTAPTCTLQICLASGPCALKKTITDTCSKVTFITRLEANVAQTAIFITSCSGPARVTLRFITTPGRAISETTIAALGVTSSTQLPETSTTTTTTSTTDVLTTSSSASLSTSDPARQPTPLPQGPASTRVRAISLCGYNRPILVSVPENPDYMLLTESGVTYDLGLDNGNGHLSFTPLNGQALCANISRIVPEPTVSPIECSRDGFTYEALPGDVVTLDCTSDSVPALDLADAVSIRFQTSGSCPSIVRQLGCQASGDSCLLNVYEGTVDSTFQLPRDPIHIKAIGEGWKQANLQVTAPGRAMVSYVQEQGNFVTMDPDLMVSGTLIQIECDIPLVPKVFTVFVLNGCPRPPGVQMGSASGAQVAPLANAPILVSSDNKVAQVSWGGYNADHTICVLNTRTMGRACGDYTTSTSGLGDLADGDNLALGCPISTVYAKVVNSCPQSNAAIFGTTSQPDSNVLRAGDSLDFNVPYNDASATITPLGGYRMCALGVIGLATACGTDPFKLTDIVDQDTVQLSCTDDPAPLPDFTTSIPLSIQTGPSCPSNLVLQIGCEGSYCQGLGYVGGPQSYTLSYPVMSPAARLQVRVIGTFSASTQWTAIFDGGVVFLDQVDQQWLEIAVPDGASKIDLRTSCIVNEPLLQLVYAVIYNYCSGVDLLVTNTVGQVYTISAYSGQYVPVYLEIPHVSVQYADGRSLCVESQRLSTRTCGASPFTIDGIVDGYDTYSVCC